MNNWRVRGNNMHFEWCWQKYPLQLRQLYLCVFWGSATVYQHRDTQSCSPYRQYWRSVTGRERDGSDVHCSKPLQSRRKKTHQQNGSLPVTQFFPFFYASCQMQPEHRLLCPLCSPCSSTVFRAGGTGQRNLGVTLILSRSRMLWRGSNGWGAASTEPDRRHFILWLFQPWIST